MKVLGLIPCRGGSKGIPRKNLAPLAGKPLLAWTIEQALAAGCLDRVVVSTEDEEIAAVARKWEAEVPFRRPARLAGDEASVVDAALHALNWLSEQEDYQPDYLMLLQVTSPLRQAADLEAAVALALEGGGEAVVGVCPARVHPFLTRRLTADGRLVDFQTWKDEAERRQDFPPAFAVNGAVYLVRCDVFRRKLNFHPQGSQALIMPPERSLDVDTPWDLHLAELILRDRLKHEFDR